MQIRKLFWAAYQSRLINSGKSHCSMTHPSFSAHTVPRSELHPVQQQPLEAWLGWRIMVSKSGRSIPAGSCLWQSCESGLRLDRSLKWSSRIGKKVCAPLLWAAFTNDICRCVLRYRVGLVWSSWFVGRWPSEGDEIVSCCSLVSSGVSYPPESQRRSGWPLWYTCVSEKHQCDPDSWRDKVLNLFAQILYPVLFSLGL